MFLIYDSYKLNQNKRYENQINQIITINKEFMNSNLRYIKKEIEEKKSVFSMIEKELYHRRSNINFDVSNLKESLSKKFSLKEKKVSLEVFVLNQEYKIIRSSNIFDIGHDISVHTNEKTTLDTMQKLHTLTQSRGVFFDSFDQQIKKYAFFKLENSTFIGISLVFEFSEKHKEAFKNLVLSLHAKLSYRYVVKDKNNTYHTMSLFINQKDFGSRAKYYDILYNIKAKSVKELAFIKASKKKEIYRIKKENTLYTYIPLLTKENDILPLFADLILEIESDTSTENSFFQKTSQHVIYFILMHLAMVIMIFYFTTSYQNLEMNLKKAISKNHDLVKYNKNFIANMVHQIRTPLAVIMSNLSFLEYFSNTTNKHSQQINASITTLSNSYENLSYINSCESLLYAKKQINLSDFLKKRVLYFDSAADANKINLITNISDNSFFTINDIELERIFDNNITNILKYSSLEEDAFISLKKNSLGTIITFKNYGDKIEDLKSMFVREIKNTDEERLHFGLCIVNIIAQKYDIKIVYKRENEYNIFEYHFKHTT